MKKLQEVTDYMVMGAEGCLDALGWSYKKQKRGSTTLHAAISL